ncbi:MAG TPA: methyltransferase domain-containing protein [Nitrospira sp.]
MSEYIFEKNEAERELGRLRLIETAVDADTIALLEQTGVAPGWRCLELGAGAGSIVDWLGSRVGANGKVWAIDKKAAYLHRFSASPYSVIEGEFLNVMIEEKVDLLHARYVLIHNKQAGEMLKQMRAIVKPGGYVVLEEPDFTSAMLLNPTSDAAQQRVNESICRMFTNAGLDPAYGVTLARRVVEAGFTVVEAKGTMHLCRGLDPIANVMAESALVLRGAYRNTGIVTDQDIDRYVMHARDPERWSLYYSTFSVIARAREEREPCSL